jgi:hypothetical protein
MEFHTIVSEDLFALAGWHNVLVGVWYSDGTLAQIDALRVQQLRFHQRFPTGYNLITVLRPDRPTGRPSDAVMAAATRLKREMDPFVLANVVVMEKTGLTAALMRSVVTAVNMISGSKTPSRVMQSLEEAVEWMARAPGQDPLVRIRAPELLAGLRTLR